MTNNLSFEMAEGKSTRPQRGPNLSGHSPWRKPQSLNQDIKIAVGNATFSTHKKLLQECSTYFKRRLRGNDHFIELPEDIELEGLGNCIESMYLRSTSSLGEYLGELNFAQLTKTLKVAHFLGMATMKEQCQAYICLHLQIENGLELVQMFRQYGSEQYLSRAQAFVTKNIETIAEQDLFLNISAKDFYYYIQFSHGEATNIWRAIYLWITHDESRKRCMDKVMDIFLTRQHDHTLILPEILKFCLVRKMREYANRILEELHKNSRTICENLDPTFSIKILLVSKQEGFPIGGLTGLMEASIQCLAENVEELRSMPNYQELPYEYLYKVLQTADKKVETNMCKWNLIVSWVVYEGSRKAHTLDLIKTLQNLRPKFISRYMKVESIVKESADCQDYLLNLQLRRGQDQGRATGEKQTVLAMLDDGRSILSLLSVEKKTFAKVDLPKKNSSETARVASLSGELFLHYGEKVMKMKKDGSWTDVFVVPGSSQSWTQFTTFDNKLAIITSQSTILYDLIAHRRKIVDGCKLGTGFSSTGANGCIYAVGGFTTADYAKCYSSAGRGNWVDLPRMPVLVSEPATVCHDGKLYVLGGSYFALKSNVASRFDRGVWERIPSMLYRRSRFAATVHNGAFFVAGGKGGLFNRYDVVEKLNNQSFSWREIGQTKATKGIVSLTTCDVDTACIPLAPWMYGIGDSNLRRRCTMPI